MLDLYNNRYVSDAVCYVLDDVSCFSFNKFTNFNSLLLKYDNFNEVNNRVTSKNSRYFFLYYNSFLFLFFIGEFIEYTFFFLYENILCFFYIFSIFWLILFVFLWLNFYFNYFNKLFFKFTIFNKSSIIHFNKVSNYFDIFKYVDSFFFSFFFKGSNFNSVVLNFLSFFKKTLVNLLNLKLDLFVLNFYLFIFKNIRFIFLLKKLLFLLKKSYFKFLNFFLIISTWFSFLLYKQLLNFYYENLIFFLLSFIKFYLFPLNLRVFVFFFGFLFFNFFCVDLFSKLYIKKSLSLYTTKYNFLTKSCFNLYKNNLVLKLDVVYLNNLNYYSFFFRCRLLRFFWIYKKFNFLGFLNTFNFFSKIGFF